MYTDRAIIKIVQLRLHHGRMHKSVADVAMESEEIIRWLKNKYCSAPTDGELRDRKKVKYEHIRKDMTAQFPSKKLSNYQVSQGVCTTFPNTFSHTSTHDRTKHIFSLEEITNTTPSCGTIDLEAENQ